MTSCWTGSTEWIQSKANGEHNKSSAHTWEENVQQNAITPKEDTNESYSRLQNFVKQYRVLEEVYETYRQADDKLFQRRSSSVFDITRNPKSNKTVIDSNKCTVDQIMCTVK